MQFELNVSHYDDEPSAFEAMMRYFPVTLDEKKRYILNIDISPGIPDASNTFRLSEDKKTLYYGQQWIGSLSYDSGKDVNKHLPILTFNDLARDCFKKRQGAQPTTYVVTQSQRIFSLKKTKDNPSTPILRSNSR